MSSQGFIWYGEEVCRTQISRGSKSRNKVSVGEPAEGSLLVEIVFRHDRIDFRFRGFMQLGLLLVGTSELELVNESHKMMCLGC